MTKETQFAGFWIRFVAHLIDAVILHFGSVILQFVILGAVFWAHLLFFAKAGEVQPSFFNYFDSFRLQIMVLLIRCVLSLGYYTGATYRYGTTIGKRILRVYVVSAEDHSSISLRQSLVRCLSYVISAIPFAAGYIMAAYHPKKQAFHDWVAGTVCIIQPKTPSSLPTLDSNPHILNTL
jgi:uncharacterized RDD family membrane protein YckC